MKEKDAREYSVWKALNFPDQMIYESNLTTKSNKTQKDILIVVKDQYEYIKNCLESLYANTENFNVFVWDNASEEKTKTFLESYKNKSNYHLIRTEKNEGFNEPNNRLAELTKSPYIILLNSDTEVKKNWDLLMMNYLEENPNTKLVGYGGGVLNEEARGGEAGVGQNIDYVAGWSVCMSRETYEKFGLFDEKNLHFAYCEDADLSLRVKEAGYNVYALFCDLVLHFENRTAKAVNQDPEFRKWFSQIFEANHSYMKSRWLNKGILLRELN